MSRIGLPLSKRSRAALIAFFSVLGVLLVVVDAHAQPLTILHHERLVDLELTGAETEAADVDAAVGPVEGFKPAPLRAGGTTVQRLRFTAFGREFSAVLEPNDRLLHGLAPAERAAFGQVELYRGRLDGLSESWVRLSRHRDEISGAIWDGIDLYAIEPAKRVRAGLAAPSGESDDEPIIFRFRDTVGALTDELIVPSGNDDGPVVLAPVEALAALESGVPGVLQLDIGLVADVEFFVHESSDAAAAMLSMINVADGIFAEQVGIHLNVAAIVVHEEEDDPFSGGSATELLRELERHKRDTPELTVQGLAHLFTARPLGESPLPGDNVIVGMANFGSVCHPVYGASLSDARFGSGGLITAHEIAHVLGAPHDGEGSCFLTPATYLMAPLFNGSRTFSQCSLEHMWQRIADAECLKVVAETDLAISGLASGSGLLLGETVHFTLTIDNVGGQDAFGVVVELDGVGLEPLAVGPGDFECTGPATALPWRCTAAKIPAGRSGKLDLHTVASQIGTAALTATVSARNEIAASNNQTQIEVEILPTVQLAFFEPSITPKVLSPGRAAEAAIVLRNEGGIDATNVEVRVINYSFEHLELEPRVAGSSACVAESSSVWSCPVGTLAVGDRRSIKLNVRAKEDVQVEPGTTDWAEIRLLARADEQDQGLSSAYSFNVMIAHSIADLGVSLIPPAGAIRNAETTARVVVENFGPDPAADVILSYSDLSAEIDNAAIDIGSCEIGSSSASCRLASLAPGQSATATIRGRAPERNSSQIVVRVESAAYDDQRDDNAVTVPYTILPSSSQNPPPSQSPQASSGGGGGGSIGTLTLLGLLGALLGGRPRSGRDRRPSADAGRREAL